MGIEKDTKDLKVARDRYKEIQATEAALKDEKATLRDTLFSILDRIGEIIKNDGREALGVRKQFKKGSTKVDLPRLEKFLRRKNLWEEATVEVIDMDRVEGLVKHGRIAQKDLDKYVTEGAPSFTLNFPK